jgi:hypothetical protein
VCILEAQAVSTRSTYDDQALSRAIQAWMGHKNIQHTVRCTELALDRFKDFWRDQRLVGITNDRQGGPRCLGSRSRGSFSKHRGTSDEHAIADLICDLGHLADARGSDFLDEVKRGIGRWYAERHASDRDRLGPDAAVEITITLR